MFRNQKFLSRLSFLSHLLSMFSDLVSYLTLSPTEIEPNAGEHLSLCLRCGSFWGPVPSGSFWGKEHALLLALQFHRRLRNWWPGPACPFSLIVHGRTKSRSSLLLQRRRGTDRHCVCQTLCLSVPLLLWTVSVGTSSSLRCNVTLGSNGPEGKYSGKMIIGR